MYEIFGRLLKFWWVKGNDHDIIIDCWANLYHLHAEILGEGDKELFFVRDKKYPSPLEFLQVASYFSNAESVRHKKNLVKNHRKVVIACSRVCVYLCMAITYYSKVWISRVGLPILLVVS